VKRSSRLIILVGIILAVAAFAGVILLSQSGNQQSAPPPVTTTKVVTAAADIPLGTVITAELLATKEIEKTAAAPNAYAEPSSLTGRVVRRDVRKGETLVSTDFASGVTAQGDDIVRALDKGQRAMSVVVDRTSGVGTIIQPGDRVDAVIALNVQMYVANPAPEGGTPVKFPDDAQITVKNILQNLEVLGTMSIDTESTGQQQAAPAASGEPAAAQTGPVSDAAKEIVILAVTAQQAEVIKYAQVLAVENKGSEPPYTITLILRSPADASSPPDKTSGITLKVLVDQYGILPPAVDLPTK
jgi:Flp pilus assembly protein CpaB